MLFENQEDNSIFQAALRHYQNGEWTEGQARLNELMERNPLDHNLRTLSNEMQLRSKFDSLEEEENEVLRKQRNKVWGIRSLAATLVVALMVWAAVALGGVIRQQVDQQRVVFEQNVKLAEVAFKYRDAQNLLQAGYFTEAKNRFLEVKSEIGQVELANRDIREEDLENYLVQANEGIEYEKKYQEARQLLENGEVKQAYDLYNEILVWRPNYKDAEQQIIKIERGFLVEDLFSTAERAYIDINYNEAIGNYEQIRSIDTTYQQSVVEEHLFDSYIKAAEEIIAQDTESLDALNLAETYFRKALSLRPQDPETRVRRAKARDAFEGRLANSFVEAAQKALIGQADSLAALGEAEEYLNKAVDLQPNDQSIRVQRDLAVKYLAAMDNFAASAWDDVILQLTEVVLADPDYADYTAAQALYEAYMARGRSNLAAGLFEIAMEDLQQAVVLAREIPNAILQEFEGQVQIADVYGLEGEYATAVQVYRTAIELSDFGQLAIQNKPELVDPLNYSSFLADNGNFKASYTAYREVLRQSLDVYDKITHEVGSGDYLPQLARKYNTTVQAILDANKVKSATALTTTQLIIPVLPGSTP
jgi:tetratricopeptide (TPR) repeat protein